MISKPLSIIFKNEWLIWSALAIFSFVGASLLMSGWPNGLVPDIVTPFSYAGDGMAYMWNVQRVLEGSWYFENARSGFPFGSNHLDYPTSDTGSYLALKLLGIGFHGATAVMNVYYLIGFSLCAVAAYLVSRSIGVSKAFSVAVALLYTFTSFHFGRIGHLFFTWYFVAPLFFYVGFRLISEKLIFTNAIYSIKVKLLNAVALMALASFGIYYSLFGCMVIVICTVIATALFRSWRYVREGLQTLGFVVTGVLLNVLPSLVHIFRNGENREGINRLAAESELYALKITQLLLPRGDHRLDSFFEFTSRYNSSFPLITENVSASLGVIGSMGFLMLIGIVLIMPFYLYKTKSNTASTLNASSVQFRLQVLATLTLAMVLMATIGGFSSLFAMLISSSIRAWNRISIFIGFLSVLAFMMAADSLIKKNVATRFLKLTSFVVASILLVFGILDQTVKPCHTCQQMNRELFNNDRAFIQDLEKSLPKNSAIYQLPYMAYSDNGPIHGLGSYDQARGHLHSDNLKWSYGSMRGREGDWFFRKLSHLPISQQVSVVSAMGFSGIYIDRRGYMEINSENEKKCAKFENSQVARLKNNCLTDTELEHDILNSTEVQTTQQIKTSRDSQLVFVPLKSTISDMASVNRANSYLLPISFKLAKGIPVQLEGGFENPIDLREDDPDLPTYVGGVSGLAGIAITNGKRLGRWSDALSAKRVTVWLAKPLPKKFTLSVHARAAGLNVGKPMQIKVGKQTKDIVFGSEFETKTVSFEIEESVYKIEFKPADPFSPARRWGYGDTNLIAILFQQILITPN